jgi:type VI secretion system secreted protein Hcp
MAFDAFLKIDGIDGESTDGNHQGWIEVRSCDNKISQTVSTTASSAGGATTGRANFQDLRITKLLDKASPKLAIACADGTHINTVIIKFCRSGTEKIKFMEIKLTNCIISDYARIADGRDFPIEGISFNFGRIEYAYVLQNRKGGGAGSNIASGWDVQKLCKI